VAEGSTRGGKKLLGVRFNALKALVEQLLLTEILLDSDKDLATEAIDISLPARGGWWAPSIRLPAR